MPNAKASVLEQFNAPLRCTEFPLPDKLETGAALVRTEMAGICGTDVHLWKGQLPISLPIILGHETVGCIQQLAEGIERDWTGHPLKIGDRVTWTSTTSCGECYYCKVKRQPTRCPERRAYGIGQRCDHPPHLFGGYAEFHYLRPRSSPQFMASNGSASKVRQMPRLTNEQASCRFCHLCGVTAS